MDDHDPGYPEDLALVLATDGDRGQGHPSKARYVARRAAQIRYARRLPILTLPQEAPGSPRIDSGNRRPVSRPWPSKMRLAAFQAARACLYRGRSPQPCGCSFRCWAVRAQHLNGHETSEAHCVACQEAAFAPLENRQAGEA